MTLDNCPLCKPAKATKKPVKKTVKKGGSLASDNVMNLVSCDAPTSMRGGAACTADPATDVNTFIGMSPSTVPASLPGINPTSINYADVSASTAQVLGAPLAAYGTMNNTFVNPPGGAFTPPLLVGGAHCKICEKIMKALHISGSKPKSAKSKKSQKKPKV